MNQAKLVSLILLAAITLTGAGYSYWNDSITVTGTVSTGKLCVQLLGYDDCDDIEAPYALYNGARYSSNGSGNEMYDISPDGHTLSTHFKDVFPGMSCIVPFKMANLGTLPAVLKDCTVTWDITDPSLNPCNKEVFMGELEKNLIITSLKLRVCKAGGDDLDTVEFVNGSGIALGELQSSLNEALSNSSIRLEPGDYIQLAGTSGNKAGGCMSFLFGEGFSNNFESREFVVKIHLDWKQYNDLR